MPEEITKAAPKIEIKTDAATTAPTIKVDETIDVLKEVKVKKAEPKPSPAEVSLLIIILRFIFVNKYEIV